MTDDHQMKWWHSVEWEPERDTQGIRSMPVQPLPPGAAHVLDLLERAATALDLEPPDLERLNAMLLEVVAAPPAASKYSAMGWRPLEAATPALNEADRLVRRQVRAWRRAGAR